MSNELVNSYWEKNLPSGYRKPDANASNHEVTEFLTNKYVHKKKGEKDIRSQYEIYEYLKEKHSS